MLSGSGSQQVPVSPYDCFVYEGGGAKGVLYPGALQVLQDLGILKQMHSVGGSSVGALTAILTATGWSTEKIKNTFDALDLSELAMGGLVDKLTIPITLHRNYALFNPKNIHKWLGDIIAEVCGNKDMDFEGWHRLKEEHPELGLKDIFVTATNLNTGVVEVFSHLSKHKNVPIRSAGRASAAFPFVLAPFEINGCLYADGGMQQNCPSSIFEETPGEFNPRVLSIRLDSASEIAFYEDGTTPESKSLKRMCQVWAANFKALLNVQNAVFNQSPYAEHTVYADTLDADTLEFNMPEDKRKKLFASGQYAMIRYMHQHHPELTRAVYHPKLLEQIERNNFERSFAEFVKFQQEQKANKVPKQEAGAAAPKAKSLGAKPYKEWRMLSFSHYKRAANQAESSSSSAAPEASATTSTSSHHRHHLSLRKKKTAHQ